MADILFESTREDLDQALAKNISEELLKQYPAYTWVVHVDGMQGVGSVRLAEFRMDWGFSFKLSEIDHDPSYKVPVRGGGEILERLGWPRGRMNTDRLMTHKTVAGQMLFDYHCSKSGKVPSIVKQAYAQLRGRLS